MSNRGTFGKLKSHAAMAGLILIATVAASLTFVGAYAYATRVPEAISGAGAASVPMRAAAPTIMQSEVAAADRTLGQTTEVSTLAGAMAAPAAASLSGGLVTISDGLLAAKGALWATQVTGSGSGTVEERLQRKEDDYDENTEHQEHGREGIREWGSDRFEEQNDD